MDGINDFNNLSTVGNTSNGATSRGTKISKEGNQLGQDSFLKILTAELSNQDPDNAKDSTQYIAQMAQFAGLEQMTNLNSTMTFSSASNLVGKIIKLNDYDNEGNPYEGVVKSIKKDGSKIRLNVILNDGNFTEKEFDFSNVASVENEE